MDTLYTISSTTKRKSFRTKGYKNIFKKILKDR